MEVAALPARLLARRRLLVQLPVRLRRRPLVRLILPACPCLPSLPARRYVRMRQLLQWVFAGAPGHPALRELCDRIAASVEGHRSFSSDARINTLERTGAGLFTDVLLRHAAAHPPARPRDDPWGVRLLPRVLFGAPTAPAYGLTPADPGVAVLHHSASNWQPDRCGCGWRCGGLAAACRQLQAHMCVLP